MTSLHCRQILSYTNIWANSQDISHPAVYQDRDFTLSVQAYFLPVGACASSWSNGYLGRRFKSWHLPQSLPWASWWSTCSLICPVQCTSFYPAINIEAGFQSVFLDVSHATQTIPRLMNFDPDFTGAIAIYYQHRHIPKYLYPSPKVNKSSDTKEAIKTKIL